MTEAVPPAVLRLEATVRGRVQGVGFRVFVVRRAMALGLDGWVANASSGAVDVVAEGARADLDALLAALRSGPPAALVQAVDERWGPARGEADGFAIRSGAHRGD
jgi:acylphosphatase